MQIQSHNIGYQFESSQITTIHLIVDTFGSRLKFHSMYTYNNVYYMYVCMIICHM